jgi:ankyrin repeat protein
VYTAAYAGHEHIVRCLVQEFGADVNTATFEGATPLMVATEQKYHVVIVWLT